MKKAVILLILSLVTQTTVLGQSAEIQQLLLNVEKLAQLKQILSDMKKGYEIVSKGYTTVKDLSAGNFNLHKAFLDGLMQVRPAVKKYKRVSDIIHCQLQLTKEYKTAYGRFRNSGHLTANEVAYIGRVYSNLVKLSLQNIEELTMVVTSGQLRMSDDERLTAIDRIYGDMESKLAFLRNFNDKTSLLILQRKTEQNDVDAVRKMYGVKN